MKKGISITVILLFIISQVVFNQDNFIYNENGRLYHPNGEEVALWGVNLQPMLSWEYRLLKGAGVQKDAESINRATDESLDELELIGCRLIRCHLTPADFTDDKGNLVETVFLDALDYMVAEAAKRNIYLYITFINHMGSGEVKNSFMQGYKKDRVKWIADKEFVKKSKKYITQLLNRENKYSKFQYKADSAVAVWEIINEPDYLKYDTILSGPYAKQYKKWLKRNKLKDGKFTFFKYRQEMVLNYINEMYNMVRKTGAKQPVSWCCNWHRMIIGHEDVFDAISQSKVEAVSFCNYPGQSVCKHPYYENPQDLTKYNYSDWYVDCYEKEEYYGWTLKPEFQSKAKLVYEFETFYNQSAYLYPVMADFFRSMGVQMAAMWQYSMPAYAEYRGGSHVLNIKCTPAKAASFAVAGKIFEETSLLQPYHIESTTEWQTNKYMYSYKKNVSAFSDDNYFYHSADIDNDFKLQASSSVKEIFGYGNSPLVNYTGTSNYIIKISDKELDITIHPDVRYRRELWKLHNMDWGPVTTLDSSENRTLKLNLNNWSKGKYTLYEIKDGVRQKKGTMNELTMFLNPGHYLVVKE